MTQLEFRSAIRDAIAEEMRLDQAVVCFGEDVAAAGGIYGATPGLLEEFGHERVFDTPISELALGGAAFGAAITGLRPVVEVMYGDFMGLPMDSLVNQSAKYWFMSGEQGSVPIVVRCAVGGGLRLGAVHSQICGTWFQSTPGLKIVMPSTPAEAKALLKAAIRDPNPVLFLEHKALYSMVGSSSDEVCPPTLGRARIARAGTDVTIVSVGKGVLDAIEAAAQAEEFSISAEVIDLRCLRPLDVDAVVSSVRRTGRLLAVEEGPRTGGWAAGLIGAVAECALPALKDAWVLGTADTPIPFSAPLEDAFLPSAASIVEFIASRMG